MNSCPHSNKAIAYILDMLADKEKELFAEHLNTCSVCQHEMKIEKTIDNELSESFEPEPLENIVMARVRMLRVFHAHVTGIDRLKAFVYVAIAIAFGWMFAALLGQVPFDKIFDWQFTFPEFSIPPMFFLIGIACIGIILTVGSIVYSVYLIRRP